MLYTSWVSISSRSSKKRKAAQNNNDKEALQTLRGGDKPAKPTRIFYDSNKPNQPGDTSDSKKENPPLYAAVVSHHKNRGNNRYRNGGINGTGTVSSDKSAESGSSAEMKLMGSGDLYDSVINGTRPPTFDRKSAERVSGRRESSLYSSEKGSQRGSVDRESPRTVNSRVSTRPGSERDSVTQASDRASSQHSTDRDSPRQNSVNHSPRYTSESGSCRSETPSVDNDLNESRVNGLKGPNKQSGGVIYGAPELI